MELPSILALCAQPEFRTAGGQAVLPIRDNEPILSPSELESARKTRTEINLCVHQGWLELKSYEEITGTAKNGTQYPAARVRLKITEKGEEEIRRHSSKLKHTK